MSEERADCNAILFAEAHHSHHRPAGDYRNSFAELSCRAPGVRREVELFKRRRELRDERVTVATAVRTLSREIGGIRDACNPDVAAIVDGDVLAVVAGLVLAGAPEPSRWPADPGDEGVNAAAVPLLLAEICSWEIRRVGLASDEHASVFVDGNTPR